MAEGTGPNENPPGRWNELSKVLAMAVAILTGVLIVYAVTSHSTIARLEETTEKQTEEVFGFYNLINNFCVERFQGQYWYGYATTTNDRGVITSDITCVDVHDNKHRFTVTYDQYENLLEKLEQAPEVVAAQ